MPGLLPDQYLDAIKGFEGYQPNATWDYHQYSNGYGTKAAYPGEKIDKDTAEKRFQSEIGNAANTVDQVFPNLPEGARAALTSLTYNAGPGWIHSRLGNAVNQSDWATARDLFMQYNRAGGQVSPGLASRRSQEAAWLVGVDPATAGSAPVPASQPGSGVNPANVAQQQSTAPLTYMGQSAGQPQGNQGAALYQLAQKLMAPPQFQPMQPMPNLLPPPMPRPQVDYSGLQALLRNQQGTA